MNIEAPSIVYLNRILPEEPLLMMGAGDIGAVAAAIGRDGLAA